MLLVLLAGIAAVNLLGAGSYQSLINLTLLVVLVHGGRSLWQQPTVPRPVLWLLLAPAVFLVCDVLATGVGADDYAARNMLAFVGIAAAVWILPHHREAPWGGIVHAAIVAELAAVMIVHATAIHALGRAAGLFDNHHFLVLAAVLVLPVTVHGIWTGGAPRWLGCAGAAASLVCLFSVRSLLGWLALALALVAVTLVMLPRPARRLTVAALSAGVLVVAVYPPLHEWYMPVIESVTSAVAASGPDERVELWADAWRLQQASGPMEWTVGHGFGSFEVAFGSYSSYRFVFPHHFFLEVLYNTGLAGLAAFAVALGALGTSLVRHLRPRCDQLLLATALLVVVWTFTFLTLPLLARPTAHLLGFAVGYALWALDDVQQEAERG
ncbi:MAG: O-antigen ligase family protein [Pseudomonadota bacterium]